MPSAGRASAASGSAATTPRLGSTEGGNSADRSPVPRAANGYGIGTGPAATPSTSRVTNGKGSAGSSSGSSVRNVRTLPGPESSGVSNRTVTRPSPLPCTHPCPNPACRTSCPRGPALLRRGRRLLTGRLRVLLLKQVDLLPGSLREQVLLRVVGEPGDTHAEQPHPARGVHGVQQPGRGLPHHPGSSVGPRSVSDRVSVEKS